MVATLLAGVAAGAAFPLVASAHPIYAHLRNSAILDRAEEVGKAATWKPLFLSVKQDETLVTLSETMVPGSAKAQVNRFIDLLLSVDTAGNQQKFVTSLAAIQGEAQKRFGRGFQRLASSEQETLLTALSNDREHKEHFDHLKEWISVAYYSSEEGMRELGWDGKHAFRNFPGCEHPGEH